MFNKSEYMKKYRKEHPEVIERFLKNHPNYKRDYMRNNPQYNQNRSPEAIKRSHERHNPRRLIFIQERIHLEEKPRKGVCSLCGKKIGDEYMNSRGKKAIVKKTDMHHFEYHDEDPLKDTIELCCSCHGKATRQKAEVLK